VIIKCTATEQRKAFIAGPPISNFCARFKVSIKSFVTIKLTSLWGSRVQALEVHTYSDEPAEVDPKLM
jgi:hypothetical protein